METTKDYSVARKYGRKVGWYKINLTSSK